MRPCILALDLGTTAFKAGLVAAGRLAATPVVAPYRLDHRPDGAVLCDPALYAETALQALAGAARLAREAGLEPRAVALTSQAQTYIPVDERGRPVGPAVVWTDDRAVREAAKPPTPCPISQPRRASPSPARCSSSARRRCEADGRGTRRATCC